MNTNHYYYVNLSAISSRKILWIIHLPVITSCKNLSIMYLLVTPNSLVAQILHIKMLINLPSKPASVYYWSVNNCSLTLQKLGIIIRVAFSRPLSILSVCKYPKFKVFQFNVLLLSLSVDKLAGAIFRFLFTLLTITVNSVL